MVAVEIGLLPWLRPSPFRIAAEPAAEEAEHHPAPAVLPPAGERQRVDGGERAAVGALGRGLGERAEHGVDDAQDRLGIAADRLRRRDAEQRRIGNDELDRREAAGIGRHVDEQMLERDVAAGDRGRARDVERPLARRRGAREVEPHAVAADRQVERDAQRLVGDAVIVEEIVVRIGAVRQRGDVGAHQRLGARRERLERGGDRVVAVFVEQRVHALLAEVERVELAVEVAPVRLRHARIGGEDVDDVLLHDAAADQLHRRHAKAFLEALGRLGVEVARHVAADVEPVADRGEPGEHLAAAHDRAHQAEVVEMRAAVVGVVEQIGVARLQPAVARDLVDHGLDRERHGADEDRQAGRALHQRRAGFGVIEPVAGVVRLGDDRIERRAEQRRVHLVGDLHQTAVEHRKRDGIERPHQRGSDLAPAPGSGPA